MIAQMLSWTIYILEQYVNVQKENWELWAQTLTIDRISYRSFLRILPLVNWEIVLESTRMACIDWNDGSFTFINVIP